MPNYYTYLISSLPMLQFGANPPFSYEALLQKCRDLIPEEDVGILKTVSISGEYSCGAVRISTLKKWIDFDTALRNELVRVRSARRRIDAQRYLRGDTFTQPSLAHNVMGAYRSSGLLEAEKALDQARWQTLNELSVGHFFDLDSLIIYALKLQILERWQRINSADKTRVLEETLQRGQN